MTDTIPSAAGSTASAASTPARLHHNAFVVKDQRATQRFYEGIVGLPLLATWCEVDELFGAERVYCHTFYGLEDGSALAFFQFANEADQALFEAQFRPTPFVHIALKTSQETQDGIKARLQDAGWDHFTLDHGYCLSLYATDPDGLIVEFTVDHPDVDKINATRRTSAHADLERWLAGDHTSNNTYRPE
jgi:catechol 2,3-dioxygenase-like lactoylglutathione lyase family enzyme